MFPLIEQVGSLLHSCDGHTLHGRFHAIRESCSSFITEESYQSSASNTLRWSLFPDHSHLDLAHLRFGPSRPVHLVSFDLANPRTLDDGAVVYRSGLPHRCRDDLYSATLTLEANGDLVLRWRIAGPGKNQTIVTRYAAAPIPAEET